MEILIDDRIVWVRYNLTQPYRGQEAVAELLKRVRPLRVKEKDLGGQVVQTLIFGRSYLERRGLLERIVNTAQKEEKIGGLNNSLWNLVNNWERHKWLDITEKMSIAEVDQRIEDAARKMFAAYGDKAVEKFAGDYYLADDYYERAREFLAQAFGLL